MDASSSDWPVHQLWPPFGDKRRTDLDIVLFHGLQLSANDINHAWTSTWTQRGHDNVCWPQEWLPCDLGEAVRIFSVSYDVHVVTSPHDHVSEIADNLFQNFVDRRYEWQHPIVLIGHSFGGLVLKSLVVKLERESTIRNPSNSFSKSMARHAKAFLRNVRGVAFYAVPHAGSTNIPTYVNKLLRCKNRHHRGIMGNIEPYRRDMNQLSVDFDRIVTENEISIYAFCEGQPMKHEGILVEFSSAQQSARNNCYKVEDANHMEVCKPPSKAHPSYALLLQFIITCGKVASEFDEALQKFHDLPPSTFGQESYVERLETLVTSEGRNGAPRYVGVWGMGGVGKTLLLQKVDGSPTVRCHFQGAVFIWLTVGQTPDLMALYQTLSEELGLEPKKHANPEDYKRYLHTQFIQRRVFLVLDDVWKNKAFDSLDLAKGKGSVTLLSTRNQSLLERGSPCISQVHMTPLSKEDSWSLFCVHAFREPSNVPGELEVLAHLIAEECQGLPLALKVIGRAMYGKISPELQWEPVLKKLRQSRMQERTVEEELYECLKLGYDVLSEDDERLKDCFLHFVAFPEDHEFSFTDIFCHWVGEGWIPGNGEDDPRADAYSLLKKLCERSLIQSIVSEEESLVMDEYFKIHDVMRDVAFYILKNDSAVPSAELLYLYRPAQNLAFLPQGLEGTLEQPSKVRRVSLYQNKLQCLPENLYAPELVCLLLGANPIYDLDSSLNSFPKLRILDLRNGEFRSLPEEIGELEDLVYLDLSNCPIQTIPDTVGNLHKLKCLMIYCCTELKYLPSGVVGLTSLQILDTSDCESLSWAEQTSSSTAGAEFLDHDYATNRASLEDICELSALTELSISEVVKIPQNISALSNLKILNLELWNLTTLPANMPHWCIQLQQLEIGSAKGLKFLPKSFTRCGAFPALINLKIDCTGLVEFPEVEDGALSKLRILQFYACYSLETLPVSLNYLTSLKKLILRGCRKKLYESCMQNSEKAAVWRTPIFIWFSTIG
ncbi:unnamed protein product [Sphagnum troendelagicum]